MALMQKKGDHRIRFKEIAPRPASSLLWQVVRGDQKERAKKERDRLNEKSRGYYLKMEKEMMPDMLGNQSSIL